MIVVGSGAKVLSVTVIDVLLAGVIRPLFTRGKTPTRVRPIPHRERAVKIAHHDKFVSSLTGARNKTVGPDQARTRRPPGWPQQLIRPERPPGSNRRTFNAYRSSCRSQPWVRPWRSAASRSRSDPVTSVNGRHRWFFAGSYGEAESLQTLGTIAVRDRRLRRWARGFGCTHPAWVGQGVRVPRSSG
jgi:hypothetical protein